MPEWLQESFWQWVIGIVVAIVLGVAAIYGPPYLQRTRRELWYRTFSWPLVEDTQDERIRILYNSQPVNSLYIVILALRYRGNQPIRESDYESPISLKFWGRAQVLSAEMVRAVPEDIAINPTVEDTGCVSLTPVLFNDGDHVSIKVLVDQYQGLSAVNGRIAGVERIRNERERGNRMGASVTWFIRNSLLIHRTLMVVALIMGLASIALENLALAVATAVGMTLTGITLILWAISIDIDKFTDI